jgi:hypothetical protein
MKTLWDAAVKRAFLLALLIGVLGAAIAIGCGASSSSSTSPAVDDDDDASPIDDDATPTDDDASPADDDASPTAPEDYWIPSTVVPMSVYSPVRGLTLQRGLVHAHSVHSWDACDENPQPGGQPNVQCLAQFRTALCTTDQQFVMLTDHANMFADYEFPAVLLYLPNAGDQLLYDGNAPIANVISCPDGGKVILTAGTENNLMPIHMTRQLDGSPDERKALYGGSDEATVQGLKPLGAQVIVNHSEEWQTDAIGALSVDGMEFYNLHANLGTDTTHKIQTILKVLPYILPYSKAGHPDLVLLSFFSAIAMDTLTFDKLTASRHLVGVMGTDCHRNAIPFALSDGDRGDSYRRVMRWFSNYLLTTTQDLAGIEDALSKGRLYGAFSVFGEPVGFDYHAETTVGTAEMGDQIVLADNPVLHVTLPKFYNMDPSLPAPAFTAKIIKADPNGGITVASSTGPEIVYTVASPGSYRVEVDVVPNHLRKWLGAHPDQYIQNYPLIYANPIYVTE